MYIYKSYLKAVIIPTTRLAANDVLQASTQKMLTNGKLDC